MKYIIAILILLGAGYYFFQPTIDNMFGKVTNQYSASVKQNEEMR